MSASLVIEVIGDEIEKDDIYQIRNQHDGIHGFPLFLIVDHAIV